MQTVENRCDTLVMSPGTDILPLRLLAEDVARLWGGLVVAFAPLPVTTCAGVAYRPRPPAASAAIIVDPDQAERIGTTAIDVYAHELAHLIDPNRTARSIDVDARERYANVLGPLLLEHQPGTVEEARFLVTTRREPRQFPFAPLERLLPASPNKAARVLRTSGDTFDDLRRSGLTERQADVFAVRAGHHPGLIWPEWWSITDPPT